MSYHSCVEPCATAVARINRMSDAELVEHLDYLAGLPRVRSLGWRVREARHAQRPCAERDVMMTRLHEEKGLTYSEIGRLFSLKPKTVAKAIERFRRRPKGDSDSLSPSCLPYAS